MGRRRRSLWTPKVEGLESRLVLSGVGPTAQAQYMLQLVNEARVNPVASAQRVTSNLSPDDLLTLEHYNVNISQVKNTIASSTPQPPLAWNDQLAASARQLNQDMIDSGVQAHDQPDGSTPGSRMTATGYTNRSSDGENAYAYAQSVDQAMKAFLIDWGVSDSGHRAHIMQPGVAANQAFRDVGISIMNSTNTKIGPLTVTQDFGSQNNEQAQVVGAVFNDPNGVNFYAPGNGVGGVTINAVNVQTGQASSTQTWGSGGYELALTPGAYKVDAIENGQVVGEQQLNVGNVNVEADFNLNVPFTRSPAPAPIATPAPPPPAPAPVQTPTPPPVVVQVTPPPTQAPAVAQVPISTLAVTPASTTPAPIQWAQSTPSIQPAPLAAMSWSWQSWTAKVAN